MENKPLALRLKALRVRADRSMAKLARALGYSAASGYQRYEDPDIFRKETLPVEFVRKIAPLLVGQGTPPITQDEVWALAGLDRAPAAHAVEGTGRLTLTPAADMAHTPAVPGRADMPRDLPVYGTAAGSVSGAMQADMTQTADLVRRPPGLAGARDAYALYVVGDSMVPRFEDGELIVVHPHRPVRPGDDVVVQTRNHEHAPVEVLLKRMVRRTEKALVLEQFNPPGTFMNINPVVVVAVHKVLRLADLLGI